MHVAFTGTRHGMTKAQKATVERILTTLGDVTLHHGDCIGADDEADEIAARLGIWRVIHPPTDDRFRAFCGDRRRKIGVGLQVLAMRPYKARNRDIVVASAILLAAPYEDEEQPYGGTWGTVRYAREVGCPDRVILADGSES